MEIYHERNLCRPHQRIERIICASEIELDGEAYIGKYELDNVKPIKVFILGKLRQTYTNFSTKDKISVSSTSADKLSGHLKDGYIYQKTIAHIPEIIKSMLFLEEMKPDKGNGEKRAKFDSYSYYITPVKINGEQYTILSTIGQKGQKIYYDQNVFYGTPEEIFKETKISTDIKYSRLRKILGNKNESGLRQVGITLPEAQTAFTSKYSKFSEKRPKFPAACPPKD